MNLYKGKILISTPDASGDIFSRSVVLIIEHDQEGAFGLILNKKNNIISQDISKILNIDIDIYDGGPVAKDKTFFIVKSKSKDYGQKIDQNFSLTEDHTSIISDLFAGDILPEEVKIFSGYSGWAPLQLEDEIKRKIWIVIEHHQIDYTAPDNHQLWKELMKNLGGEHLIWANAPEDVMMN